MHSSRTRTNELRCAKSFLNRSTIAHNDSFFSLFYEEVSQIFYLIPVLHSKYCVHIFNFTRILYVRFVVINDGNAQWFDIREFPKCLSSFFSRFHDFCMSRNIAKKIKDTKCRLKVSRWSWNKKIDFFPALWDGDWEQV